MTKVLVVGGAGYVGSALCATLNEQGVDYWVVDDLSRGHEISVLTKKFLKAKASDESVLKLMQSESFDCVMHFAALAQVGESVKHPDLYFENNVEQTKILISMMKTAGVNRFIFSSTCAIFKSPIDSSTALSEDCPKGPVSPYGETKLVVEQFLEEECKRWNLQSIALRYFNASGAEPNLRVGERHEPETHLIPVLIQKTLQDQEVSIFGSDYPTPDGTCVRDFVHVTDLAQAHVSAMNYLLKQNPSAAMFDAFNLGTGSGHSVLEVVETCQNIIGKEIKVKREPQRAGDSARLVADSKKAVEVLRFSSTHSDLETIIETAWAWEIKRAALNEGWTKKAIFLDRDGTLNHDPGYLNDPDKVVLIDDVPNGLASLQQEEFEFHVITNQSGIGRGLVSAENLQKIHEKINTLLNPFQIKIENFHYCPHHPDERCQCRKPSPKMILDAAWVHKINLAESWMIGDRIKDCQSGKRAGCKGTILLSTGNTVDSCVDNVHFCHSLKEAADFILSTSVNH